MKSEEKTAPDISPVHNIDLRMFLSLNFLDTVKLEFKGHLWEKAKVTKHEWLLK